MTTIEHLIGDLLLQNNCVIVPSFGGFVAQQASASIDYDLGRMSPPKKSLLFNRQLVNNDGLLVNELAKKNEFSFDEASAEVAKKVEEWNTILAKKGRVELDRIGFIYKDAEDKLCFEQDRFFNLLLASFGLKQIQFLQEELVVVEKERNVEEKETLIVPILTEEVLTEKQEEATIIAHPAIRKERKKVWKYVAAAVILPVAFYSVWIPMKTDVLESGMLSFKDFNPFQKSVVAQYEHEKSNTDFAIVKAPESSFEEVVKDLPEDIEVYSYKYDDAFFIPVKIKESTEITATPEALDNIAFQAIASNYIVGCFGKESNANNLVDKLKAAGFDARIVDVKNGLHRVTAGAAISSQAFNQIKSEANSLGFKGWTLK